MSKKTVAKPTQEPESSRDKMLKRIETYCKLLATVIVVVAISVHLARILREGSCTCKTLFSNGRWNGDMWQPYGCMMHKYHSGEIRTCLQNHPVSFVGDSRTRSMYYQLLKRMTDDDKSDKGKVHSDLQYVEQENNITVSFYWQPEVNLSTQELFQTWIEVQKPKSCPSLVLTGVGTWTIKNRGREASRDYMRNLTALRSKMISLAKVNDHRLLPRRHMPPLVPAFAASPTIMWMMQDPVVESKLHKARKTITNERINLFNKMAGEVLGKSNSSVNILRSSYLVAQPREEQSTDGLHYGSLVKNAQLDILLNHYCNHYIQPADASCCVPAPRITQLQYNTMAVFVTCIMLFVVMWLSRRLWREQYGVPDEEMQLASSDGHTSSSLQWVYSDHMYPVMKSLAKLGVIMFYFYLCDRTNLFMKEQKQYSHTAFGVAIVGFLFVGGYTWEPTQQTNVLNRDQTDEWKGWMQLVILLYHYTGASKVLPIYVFIRLLVASYLFMSGYGHFSFFWTKADFSLYRFCQVMTRMNVFVVTLCLVMGRPYQFYYFVPLVSFYFVMVYLSMVIMPRVTAAVVREDPKQYVVVWLKFFTMFGLVYVIWSSPAIFDWLFSQWAIKELFIDENGSVREWRFRSGLDRYIVLFGMVFSFAYNTARQTGVIDDSHRRKLFERGTSLIVLGLSLVALGGYAIQAFTCSSKESCNATHALASCIPITAFVLLHNVPGYLRNRHSTFYAWVGKYSLELFIGQYHIFLAADTKGLLVLIPERPLLNAVVTCFVFVCVCHEVNKVTGILAQALVTKEMMTMLRRLVIFIIGLIIIWWHKTHHPLKPHLI